MAPDNIKGPYFMLIHHLMVEMRQRELTSEMPKLSHKKYRNELKKQRRKLKRQELAKLDEECQNSEEEDEEHKGERRSEEEHRKRQHELWLEREKQALCDIKLREEKRKLEIKRKEEQEKRIREEWEEQQKKEKEEEERKAKDKEERDKKVDRLLKLATENENDDSGNTWHNPIRGHVGSGKEILRECCPFFTKTGSCRFGQNCSRAHVYPDTSTVIMFPGMFTNFMLEQGLLDEYDNDDSLEYEDNEVYQHFCDFYNDVLPEFKTVGRVKQFKVCCNFEPHLRGNVYVAYRNEDDAKKAFIKFNGRFYGGKKLSAVFINIISWKAAICGLFGRNKCPKGKNCNFLHIFNNPNDEFFNADRDRSDFGPYSHRGDYHTNDYRNSRSYSRYAQRRSRSRSRTQSRRHRRSRSRSCDRSSRLSERPRSPQKRRSRSPQKRRSRSPQKLRSRSPQRKRSRSPYKRRRSRSWSRSKESKYRSNNKRSISKSPYRKPNSQTNRRNMSRSRSRSRDRYKSHKRSRSRSKSRSIDRLRSHSKSRSPSPQATRTVTVKKLNRSSSSSSTSSD